MGAARPDPAEELDRAAVSYLREWEHAGPIERSALRDELIDRCLPLLERLTRRYSGHRETPDGLRQVALLALIAAVDRYDAWRGSFTTFALITISGEIRRHFRDRSGRPAARQPVRRDEPGSGPPGRLAVTDLVHLLPGPIQPLVAADHAPYRIAERLGIPSAQIPGLRRKALSWLRAAVLSADPPPWTAVDQGDGLRIDIRHDEPLTTVRVAGEIDRDTAGRLRHRLHAALSLAAPGRLVVELTGVPFVDAAGATVLRQTLLAGSASGVDVRFAAPQPYVAAVLAVAGLPAGACVAAGDRPGGEMRVRRPPSGS